MTENNLELRERLKIKIFNPEICVCALLDTNSFMRRKRSEKKAAAGQNVLTHSMEGGKD